MLTNTQLRVYETRTLINEELFSGTKEVPFTVLSGSRMLISLHVLAIDPATTINVFVDNNFNSEDSDETILTLSANNVSRVKRVLSDFHNQFNFRCVVTGGSATFKVGISLFDNSMTTRIDNAIVEVDLHHTLDVNGMFDSVRIGNGVDLLEINTDGSINAVLTEAPNETPINEFSETPAVANGSEATVLTYTVPVGVEAFLTRIDVGGENIARFEVYVDLELIARKRTWFGHGLSDTFDFSLSARRGLPVQSGKVITVKVLHERPFAATFEARLQGLLKG